MANPALSPKRFEQIQKEDEAGWAAPVALAHAKATGAPPPPTRVSHMTANGAFLKTFFQGKKLHVDGWAHHPYSKKLGPFYHPASRTAVTIGVLGRLTKALDQYSKHRRMKVYLTEFGIQSKPDPFVGVSQTKQAEYRSIGERIAYRNSRVKAFSQYLMRDDQPRPGSKVVRYSGFESGLRTSGGTAKLAYGGIRLPLVADRSSQRRVTHLRRRRLWQQRKLPWLRNGRP